MRDAKAADWLRRLTTQREAWKTRLHRFASSGVPSLGEVEFAIQSPMTVLAGPNGAGKTTLLRAMWAALAKDASAAVLSRDQKFSAGKALVDYSVEGVASSSEQAFPVDTPLVLPKITEDLNIVVDHIDGSAFAATYRSEFGSFESSEELVNGAGVRALDDSDLADVCFILNRTYRAIQLYEVEMNAVVPFFEVTYGDDSYDSRTMGTGEMCALYIWWAVTRAEPNSVILIEEPEAYLSAASQSALARYLISQIVKKRLCAVISSHAPALISMLPAESLVFLSRGQAGLEIMAGEAHPSLLKLLGIDPPIRAIVYVEDSLAKLMAGSILEFFDAHFFRQVFISKRGGESEVKAALKVSLTADEPIRYVGLLDGDLRSSDLGECKDQVAFLPGDVSIELAFKQMASANPACLQHKSAVTIIASLEGKDNHDWYEELAREIGLSREQLFSRLFDQWITDPENKAAALATYEAVIALASEAGPNKGKAKG